jgi:hypothetical protein
MKKADLPMLSVQVISALSEGALNTLCASSNLGLPLPIPGNTRPDHPMKFDIKACGKDRSLENISSARARGASVPSVIPRPWYPQRP